MGVATDGLLVYGYDLGGDEEWKVREVDRWGDLTVDWFPGPGEEDEPQDFADKERERLLRSTGLTAAKVRVIGSRSQQLVTSGLLSVGIERHCCYGCPSYALVTHSIRVSRGSVEAVELTAMAAMPAEQR